MKLLERHVCHVDCEDGPKGTVVETFLVGEGIDATTERVVTLPEPIPVSELVSGLDAVIAGHEASTALAEANPGFIAPPPPIDSVKELRGMLKAGDPAGTTTGANTVSPESPALSENEQHEPYDLTDPVDPRVLHAFKAAVKVDPELEKLGIEAWAKSLSKGHVAGLPPVPKKKGGGRK